MLLNGGVIDDSLMQIIEPELLEAAPMQPGMAGLQELLSRAGLLEVAIAEYLDLWSEMGIDDGMLDVWHSGVITSAALEADFGIASLGEQSQSMQQTWNVLQHDGPDHLVLWLNIGPFSRASTTRMA